MKVIIAGDGKVGFALAEQLSKENHDVVIIDNNSKLLKEALESLDVMTVAGNGASIAIQREAGVDTADLLIAATSSDEVNLLCCVVARKLGCRHTIARLRNREYTEQSYLLKNELGLSMTVNPELTASREIYGILQYPSFLKKDSFAKGRVEIVEIKLDQNSLLCGKRLEKAAAMLKMSILVCAVERDGKVVIPKGGFEFEEGDVITVAAAHSELARLINKLDLEKIKIRNVIIIGGSRTAAYLCGELLKSGVSVKIIEKELERCEQLADLLPDAVIIHGDGTRQDLLTEEGIHSTDAVVSLTDIDEENLVIAMYANYVNVPKTVTKINRTEYNVLFGKNGIGSVISPKQITTNKIIRYVRAMDNTQGGSMLTLHKIVNGRVEALEFLASDGTINLGVPLSKLHLRNDVLIACISRGRQVIIPNGDDYISEGDSIVVVTTSDGEINSLNDIFTAY